MADTYRFQLPRGFFRRIANTNSTYTVVSEHSRNQVSFLFKRYLSGVDAVIGTMKNAHSSQPVYSIFNQCTSGGCSIDFDDDLCYTVSTRTWYHDDEINTNDNTYTNSTTTITLELCQPTLLSAQTSSPASLDVVIVTTTTLSANSEMTVTTHLPYSIAQLKRNPLEYKLMFNSSLVAHTWSTMTNDPSANTLQRNSCYVFEIKETPQTDPTFLLCLAMVIDELSKTLDIVPKMV